MTEVIMTKNVETFDKKHGFKDGYFRNTKVLANFESHIEAHGSLDGMLRIFGEGQEKGQNGTTNVPLKYIPEPALPQKMYDLRITSKNVYTYGTPYNENKKFAPQIKQTKFKKGVMQNKFVGEKSVDKDDKYLNYKLKDGEEITPDDITVDFKIRNLLDKYIINTVDELRKSKKWGKSKTAVVNVSNFDVKTGCTTSVVSGDDDAKIDITTPFVTYKFTEREGVISTSGQKSSNSFALQIRNNLGEPLNVDRNNINEIIPSKSKIQMSVSYSRISIGAFGINLGRYINKLKIIETPKVSSDSSDDEDDEDDE